MQTITYEEYQARRARLLEGQDDLYYKGLQVTTDFDMVMTNDNGVRQRVRPQLEVIGTQCSVTRVKMQGTLQCGIMIITPQMNATPLC